MTSFQESWAPTWQVQKSIKGARSCLIENTGRSFKTGRPIVDAVFDDGNRQEICRRQGMSLTSKKGQSYVVCRIDPVQPAATQAHSVEDVFDDKDLPRAIFFSAPLYRMLYYVATTLVLPYVYRDVLLLCRKPRPVPAHVHRLYDDL